RPDKPLVTGVEIAMGHPGDREMSVWQEMFLPEKLHDFVGQVMLRDSGGVTRPLVTSEQVLFQSSRGPEPAAPPPLVAWLLPIGIAIAAAIAGLSAAPNRRARIAGAVIATAWCV